MPASRSRAAPSSSSVAVRSIPTTSRTCGRDGLGRVRGAARHVEDEHVVGRAARARRARPRGGGRRASRARRTARPGGRRTAGRRRRGRVIVMAPLLQSDAMVVSASSARDRTVPAATWWRMRGGSPVRAGSWPEDADDLVTPWHTHELHQLLYAFEGVVEVETAGAHHLLPPQQAAWIPAGLAHQTTLRRVRSVRGVLRSGDGARPRRPRAGARGGRADPGDDRLRDAVAHRPADERPDRRRVLRRARAPRRRVARLRRGAAAPAHRALSRRSQAVMAYTQAHLADVSAADVCAAAGLSERSLRRQFPAATGMSWQQYRLTSRILRAMAHPRRERPHRPRRRGRGRLRQSERVQPRVPPPLR